MIPGKIGYARVSALHQSLDRQIAAFRAEECDRIFREKASGKSTRPELEKAIDALGTSDILVVAEWDPRYPLDARRRGADRAHQCLLKVLDRAHIDLTTPIGRGFIAFLSAMAEDERQRIIGRANGGRQAARVRGVKFGRKPKLSAFQRDEVGRRLAAGEPIGDLARSSKVSRWTITRLTQTE